VKISLFYKNVTVLDYAYLDDHRGVVGDALKVHVEFIGRTDREGVVYDFSYAKKKVKEIIDRDCDHRLVVPEGLAQESGEGNISFSYAYGLSEEKVMYECPEQGICVLPFKHVNKATIQTYLETTILKEMPETVSAVIITLEDEELPEGKASFHYTHGLKEHYGNCQRLFHGHKNTVDVKINGLAAPEFEDYLATELFKNSVHFCKWENVVNKEDILKYCDEAIPRGRFPQVPVVEIAYTSEQGTFKGQLPGRAVFMMEAESTVENLSMLFAKIVKEQVDFEDIVEVRAYEGVAKGAITTI
jgi:6-pyruvoyl-tetrahydropterin synthase